MSHRSIALVGAMLGLALLPAPALAQEPAAPPVASLDDTGRLTLDFRVQRFVVRDGRLAARGVATARLSGPGEATRTVRQRVTAPARIAQAGRRRCSDACCARSPAAASTCSRRLREPRCAR
jgi:hypothetical protein